MVSHEPSTFSIPTINISAYLENPESPGAKLVVEQIRTACATSGFFQMTGHGISNPLQQQAFRAARTFFALPDEDKRKLSGKPGRGYELIGTQTLEAGKQPDLKEVSCRNFIILAVGFVTRRSMISSFDKSVADQDPRGISSVVRFLTWGHHIGRSKTPTYGQVRI